MNAFAGIRPNFPRGGSKLDPLAFFPGVCSGGYLFSIGGPTPTTPPPIFTLILLSISTSSSAVAERPHDALCSSVVTASAV